MKSAVITILARRICIVYLVAKLLFSLYSLQSKRNGRKRAKLYHGITVLKNHGNGVFTGLCCHVRFV